MWIKFNDLFNLYLFSRHIYRLSALPLFTCLPLISSSLIHYFIHWHPLSTNSYIFFNPHTYIRLLIYYSSSASLSSSSINLLISFVPLFLIQSFVHLLVFFYLLLPLFIHLHLFLYLPFITFLLSSPLSTYPASPLSDFLFLSTSALSTSPSLNSLAYPLSLSTYPLIYPPTLIHLIYIPLACPLLILSTYLNPLTVPPTT